MATAPAAAASPHQHGHGPSLHAAAAHAQWHATPAPRWTTWSHRGQESHGNSEAHHASSEIYHAAPLPQSAPAQTGQVSAQSLSPVSAAPTAAPAPVPAAAVPPGQAKKDQTLAPAASPAPVPASPTAGPGHGVHAASLTASAPALQASGLFVAASAPAAAVIVTAAPAPIPVQFFGPASTAHHPTPAPAPTSPKHAPAALPAAPAPAKPAPPPFPGAFGEPMVLAQGAWHGLSLRAATDLRIPIGLLVAVAAFLLVQALVDRRDPKVTSAPEHGTDDTIGFQ